MPSSFKRFTSRNVGTTTTAVGPYTVPVNTTTTAIGLTVANTTTNAIKASVSLYDGVNDTFLIRNMDIVPGQSHSLIGGDQKVVMQPGDQIRVVSNTASSVDAILSVLELT